MTLLVSWTGVDTHGTASAYIAADSRVSWPGGATFDHGRKVFAFQRSPDILGYCGDVLFPTIALSQITEMADHGLLFLPTATCKQRFEAIKEKLVYHFQRYPRMVEGIAAPILQVLHISRDTINNREFSSWLVRWRRDKGWSAENVPMPSKSGVLFSLGSGAREFRQNYARYMKGPHRNTSRGVFHCFCDTLFNTEDEHCGGAPQLVGIYRKPGSSAITFGIIRERKRYFLGAQAEGAVDLQGVEWRNDLFELCDARTMKRFPGAQAQPDHLRRN
jgi:hypothetical protein